MVACIHVIILILQAVKVNSLSPATLIVNNVIPGAIATFECSLDSLTSPTTLDIYKDNVLLYQCIDIAFTCSKSSTDNDYSDVTFTNLGTTSAKGTFTVANADHTRDGGEWACQYGSSLLSSSVTFVVGATTTTTTTTPSTTPAPSGTRTTQTTTSTAITPTLSITVSSLSASASSSTVIFPTIQESETTPKDPTITSARNTNPTTTSATNTTDETNKEKEWVYFFSILPTMITLTVVIIVITFVCNRTRKIKRSRPPSGMDTYSLSRHGTHMNPAFEPQASYSMSMEHSNPFYVSRELMLNENAGSSGTNMIHDQIFFEDTYTTKEILEGIEGLHLSARYTRHWSDLNDSSVNLFK